MFMLKLNDFIVYFTHENEIFFSNEIFWRVNVVNCHENGIVI